MENKMPMTPDEVVGEVVRLKDLLARIHFKMGNSIPVRDTDEQTLISALNLIQDYQKLRERVSVEKVNDNISEQMKVYFMVNDTFLVHKFELPNQVNDALIERHYKREERLSKLLAHAIVTYLQQPTEPIER
jgi:cell division protein ZapA (FtsZ GTPase activity inhibitor)